MHKVNDCFKHFAWSNFEASFQLALIECLSRMLSGLKTGFKIATSYSRFAEAVGGIWVGGVYSNH